jgi:hypothetical protein
MIDFVGNTAMRTLVGRREKAPIILGVGIFQKQNTALTRWVVCHLEKSSTSSSM